MYILRDFALHRLFTPCLNFALSILVSCCNVKPIE